MLRRTFEEIIDRFHPPLLVDKSKVKLGWTILRDERQKRAPQAVPLWATHRGNSATLFPLELHFTQDPLGLHEFYLIRITTEDQVDFREECSHPSPTCTKTATLVVSDDEGLGAGAVGVPLLKGIRQRHGRRAGGAG